MPQITVIVPVYKVELYLHRCIDSILNQTFTDFELILVDDGSPDNCGIICDEYAKEDPRIHVIHKENGGLSDARNVGMDWVFANSGSEWITFIDSDDWVHQQYLEILYSLCNRFDVDFSSCGYELVGEGATIISERITEHDAVVNDPKTIASAGFSFSQFNTSVAWGRLYRKNIMRDIRYPIGRYHEDEFVTYKVMFSCNSIAITTTPLYYYYQNNNGIINSGLSSKKMADQLDAFYEKVCFFAEHNMQGLFSSWFSSYCRFVYRYEAEYSTDTEYEPIIKVHQTYIKRLLKGYKQLLPESIIIYGYKKWVSGEKGCWLSQRWRLLRYYALKKIKEIIIP